MRVSILGFDNGSETTRNLDGHKVKVINADLTAGTNVANALRLPENLNLSFKGVTQQGPFDIPDDLAEKMLAAPLNPNGRPNSGRD